MPIGIFELNDLSWGSRGGAKKRRSFARVVLSTIWLVLGIIAAVTFHFHLTCSEAAGGDCKSPRLGPS